MRGIERNQNNKNNENNGLARCGVLKEIGGGLTEIGILREAPEHLRSARITFLKFSSERMGAHWLYIILSASCRK